MHVWHMLLAVKELKCTTIFYGQQADTFYLKIRPIRFIIKFALYKDKIMRREAKIAVLRTVLILKVVANSQCAKCKH